MVSAKGSVALREAKPVIAMIQAQLASGGVSIFYKLAFDTGMKPEIMVFYRLLTAAIWITPFALFFERNIRPKLTWKIACQGLAIGLLGGPVGSNLYAESLKLTSATLATSMTNTIPAITLLLAVICRLEGLEIRKSSGKAKIIGTALGIGGAMVLTLYIGTTFTLWSTKINLLDDHKNDVQPHVKHNHFLGCLLVLLACFIYATWLILQTQMSQAYPPLSCGAIICVTGAVSSGVYALSREHNWNEWKLGFDIRLLSVAYVGIIGSGFETVVTAWGTKVKGPLYVASFTPLALVFVALLGSFILGEKLTLGCIIGSVLIIAGLYIVIWAKSKDTDMANSSTPTNGEGPLRMNSAGEDKNGSNPAAVPAPANITGEENSAGGDENGGNPTAAPAPDNVTGGKNSSDAAMEV